LEENLDIVLYMYSSPLQMAEETDFEKRWISSFEGVMTLILDRSRIIINYLHMKFLSNRKKTGWMARLRGVDLKCLSLN